MQYQITPEMGFGMIHNLQNFQFLIMENEDLSQLSLIEGDTVMTYIVVITLRLC